MEAGSCSADGVRGLQELHFYTHRKLILRVSAVTGSNWPNYLALLAMKSCALSGLQGVRE